MGAASSRAVSQMTAMTISYPFFVSFARRGLTIALWRSIAMAVNVKMLTLTLNTWMNGQKGHIKSGRFHRWSTCWFEKKIVLQKAKRVKNENWDRSSWLLLTAAWNWNGIEKQPIITSANARFPMKKFVTVCICLHVRTTQITRRLPRTARRLIVP